MYAILIAVIVVALGTIAFVAYNFFNIKKMDEGTEEMSEIAAAIRVGANAFINYEYKVIAIVAAIVAVVLGVLVCWEQAVCFVIGAVMSATAGYIGMKVATYANVRVSNTARTTKKLGTTLKVAFRGGSVMGLSVAAFALLGLFIVYLVFGKVMNYTSVANIETDAVNWLGIAYTPFVQCLSGYALGCSFIAMFSRIGGGIYTKAADMGADLVGKTEAHIPEDDPRNPATIADNVGDNVGDVAGLGSDLLESFVGAISAAVMLGGFMMVKNKLVDISAELIDVLFFYPLAFVTFGLVACVLGVLFLLCKKASNHPHKELNFATWLAAGLTVVFGLALSLWMFNSVSAADMTNMGFAIGAWSPWIAAALGVVSGIMIGVFAEYYTSYDYKPTRSVSFASREGSALTITQGMAVGMKSCLAPLFVLAGALAVSYFISGFYGVAMAGVGMLSFVGITVSVDAYGPISDNAGGISEMSHLEPEVRAITDELDSVGNTTAAIGKGFAIGSATFATLGLMISYIFVYSNFDLSNVAMNIIEPMTLAGALVGAALPYFFSGMLIDAVAKAARKMVDEVRRQFTERPGILTGEEKPDYKTCISISSQGALKEMRVPAILSILFPLASGFLFGPDFVAGVLMGGTLSAIMLAIFTGNAGGTWDNAKKYIETGAIEGQGKGSPAHDAGVVGDTVGDPLKDTVGPSLDILIKIMSTVSLVAVPIFSQYNLLDLFLK